MLVLANRTGFNADERSRTSTGRSPQAPEACASANSATSAEEIILSSSCDLVKIFRYWRKCWVKKVDFAPAPVTLTE